MLTLRCQTAPPPIGRGQGHVTHFQNSRVPSHIFQIGEVCHFKFGLQIDADETASVCRNNRLLPGRTRSGLVSRDLFNFGKERTLAVQDRNLDTTEE